VRKREPEITAADFISQPRPLVIGHRGNCQFAPENTLLSFELALAAGADLVELDYHLSRDGTPVVIHDSTLNRTTNAKRHWGRRRLRITQRDAEEIQTLDAGGYFSREFAGTRVPLLREALAVIQLRGRALIEHKAGPPEPCLELLRELRLVNRVIVQSFDWEYLRRFHELEPTQPLGALGPPIRLANGRKPLRLAKSLNARWLGHLRKTGAKLVVWNHRVSKSSVHLAHQYGLKVWIYTINTPRLAKRLLRAGVDGIITNDVSRMRTLLEAEG
jgi:glycerophosphoryl diester phosphodiesterase